MTHLKTNIPIVATRRRGFTLLEVMFAIMILGIGLIAVASLFPVAGTMQRNAFLDATAMQLSTSVEVQLRTRPIPMSGWNSDGKVHPIYDGELDNTYPIEDRSYPQSVADVNARKFFWRPFYRYNKDAGPTTDPNAWELYVIISKHFDGGVAPEMVAGDPARQDYWIGRPTAAPMINTSYAVFGIGSVAINVNTGLIGTVTKVRTKNGLDLEINGVDANETDWWHAIHPRPQGPNGTTVRMGHNPTLDVLKISTGGVK